MCTVKLSDVPAWPAGDGGETAHEDRLPNEFRFLVLRPRRGRQVFVGSVHELQTAEELQLGEQGVGTPSIVAKKSCDQSEAFSLGIVASIVSSCRAPEEPDLLAKLPNQFRIRLPMCHRLRFSGVLYLCQGSIVSMAMYGAPLVAK